MDRRRFLVSAGIGSVAIAGELACGPRRGTPRVTPARRAGPGTFPVVEARGGPYEVGQAIGKATSALISRSIDRRRSWFDGLKRFALADRRARLDGFVAAIRRHHPAVLAELRGLADGAGRPLDDILVLNLQPELGAMKRTSSCCNCSTLHLVHGGRVLLAHTEDDLAANRDLMVLLRVRPTGRPRFVSLAYPGVIPGNVPAITAAGLVRTTNFIGASKVHVGVPRYVLGRALLEARTIDEGLRILRSRHGAYGFHVNLGSQKERRLLSVELGPAGASDVRETKQELYVHTNHYLLPGTRKVPELEVRAGGSSDSRYRVLTRAAKQLGPLSRVGAPDLVKLLSSHEAIRQPYSPCRHPKGDVRGQTMALALFDVVAGTFTLYEGNPCEGRARQVSLG